MFELFYNLARLFALHKEEGNCYGQQRALNPISTCSVDVAKPREGAYGSGGAVPRPKVR